MENNRSVGEEPSLLFPNTSILQENFCCIYAYYHSIVKANRLQYIVAKTKDISKCLFNFTTPGYTRMRFLIMQHQVSWKTQMRHLDAKYVIFSIVVYVCGLFLPSKMVMHSQQISVRTSIILIAAFTGIYHRYIKMICLEYS